jgi:hypothetical protein
MKFPPCKRECTLVQRSPTACLNNKIKKPQKRRPRPDLCCSTIGWMEKWMQVNRKNIVPVVKVAFIFLKVGWVRPKRGCLLALAYYAIPRWYEFGERRWNDILTGENRRTRRKTWPSATLSTTNSTWIDPGANPGLRGERPATNDLSHCTAPEVALTIFFLYSNLKYFIK